MNKVVSCCGVVCSECDYYQNGCDGCPQIKGHVFWLKYTGDDICPIYNCCKLEKKYEHCGQCRLLPCKFYYNGDPTKTDKENKTIRENQVKQLMSMCPYGKGENELDC